MYPVLGAIAAVLVLLALWMAVAYNRLRGLQYACADAWSLIDVQLQRRADLIPNLVATVQGYAAHEQGVLQAITDARAQADPLHGPTAANAAAETRLGAAIVKTVALREQYPELATSEHFRHLQAALVEIENEIAASREIYNGNVAAYRNRLQQVPSSWVASWFHFEDRSMFAIELPSERVKPAVSPSTGSAVPSPGSVPPPTAG